MHICIRACVLLVLFSSINNGALVSTRVQPIAARRRCGTPDFPGLTDRHAFLPDCADHSTAFLQPLDPEKWSRDELEKTCGEPQKELFQEVPRPDDERPRVRDTNDCSALADEMRNWQVVAIGFNLTDRGYLNIMFRRKCRLSISAVSEGQDVDPPAMIGTGMGVVIGGPVLADIITKAVELSAEKHNNSGKIYRMCGTVQNCKPFQASINSAQG